MAAVAQCWIDIVGIVGRVRQWLIAGCTCLLHLYWWITEAWGIAGAVLRRVTDESVVFGVSFFDWQKAWI